jgi:hypothetical protein
MALSEDKLPEELRQIDGRLREQRDTLTPLDADRIKTLVIRRTSGSSPRMRGRPMRSRLATLAIASLIVAGGTAGAIAGSGGGGNGKGAADSQYRPGLGCGDKNHIHTGPPGNPGKTCK